MVEELVLIGGNTAAFKTLLQKLDPCYGKRYAKSAKACQECLCPVVIGGKVRLLNELCREATGAREEAIERRKQEREALKVRRAAAPPVVKPPPTITPITRAPATLKKLSYREIQQRLSAGHSWEMMFREILGDASAKIYGSEVRAYLNDAEYYIRSKHGLPTLRVPKTAELLASLNSN